MHQLSQQTNKRELIMTITFTPKTENDLYQLLEKGDYDFEVLNAEDAVSKKGNPMIKLTLKIYDKNGNGRQMYDYLLEALAFKLKHFCEATGLDDKYKAGKLEASDCLAKSGKVMIDVESSDAYPPRNSVKDYVKIKVNKDNNFIDNDIPF